MVKVAIIGAGGLARQILDVIDACQDDGQDIEAAGFIDENADLWGTSINGRPILGGLNWFEQEPWRQSVQVIIGLGLQIRAGVWRSGLQRNDCSFAR